MGIRHWFRNRMLGDDAEGDDVPPHSSLVNTLLGREEERARVLGEYDARTYPAELAELLRRREQVTAEFLRLDIYEREARMAAIPQLQAMLRKYPLPLVYEALINAYVDGGRYDEAKGVAFAARERRLECKRSPHPEIRAEVERLHEWSALELEQMKADAGPLP